MSPILVGTLLLALAWRATAFKYVCNFVGAKGFAIVTCSGRRDNISRTQVVLFENVCSLYVRVGNSYLKNTDRLHFEFLDAEDKIIHQISVWYHPWAEENRPNHPCQFPLAVERAWCHYQMQQRGQYQEDDGSWVFCFREAGWVKLSKDKIVIQKRGQVQELKRKQLAQVLIDPARFIWLQEPGGTMGFFSNTGMHEIWYGDLQNAQFFLALLTRMWKLPMIREPASRFARR